jgi:hypothetical protein
VRPALVSVAFAVVALGSALLACDGGSAHEAASPSSDAGAQESMAPRLPDPYSAPAVGITLKKPEGWVYLPQTNHPDPLRYTKRLEFPELREVITDVFTPLVAVAPLADAVVGEAPIVSVYFRFAMEPVFIQYHLRAHPEVVSNTNSLRFKDRPGFEVVEPPTLTDLGGQPGAVTRIHYVEVDPDAGTEHPVQLRIWNTKRDWGYFYVEALMPEPVSPQVESQVEALVASIHLERPMTLDDVGGKPKLFDPSNVDEPGAGS